MQDLLERKMVPQVFQTIVGHVFHPYPTGKLLQLLEDEQTIYPDIVHQDPSGVFWLGEVEKVHSLDREPHFRSQNIMHQAQHSQKADEKNQALKQKLMALPAEIVNHSSLSAFGRWLIHDKAQPSSFYTT